jgi:hypothetical protein
MEPLTILITVAFIIALLLVVYVLTPRSTKVTFGTHQAWNGLPLAPSDDANENQGHH